MNEDIKTELSDKPIFARHKNDINSTAKITNYFLINLLLSFWLVTIKKYYFNIPFKPVKMNKNKFILMY